MNLIAYTRVSTQRQGQSGLGLDAQLAAINAYATANKGTILSTYTEIESGKVNNRPELAKAIAHAKRCKGRLVIAKLDRLARNVAFVSALMDDPTLDFVACDNPHANRLTIHILAAVAEDERRRISERTKAALAAAKERGVKMGSARPGFWDSREDRRRAGQEAGRLVAMANAKKRAAPIIAKALPIIRELRAASKSFTEIAERLNGDGVEGLGGGKWWASSVWKVWKRGA